MTNERAYQRFLAVLNLARRPGTPEEGEAAMNMARKMAEKYGFDLNDQSVSSPAEQKKAQEAVRRWKKYTGKSKKDCKTVLRMAQLAGYDVRVASMEIYATNKELQVFAGCLASYQKAKKAARHEFNKLNYLQGSAGFSKFYEAYVNLVIDGEDYSKAGIGGMVFIKPLIRIIRFLEDFKEN